MFTYQLILKATLLSVFMLSGAMATEKKPEKVKPIQIQLGPELKKPKGDR